MTETQYLYGWALYLSGAAGCLLSLWFVVRRWYPRLKRSLLLGFAVLLLLPGAINPGQEFLGPALLISLYDGLSQGVDALWRNGRLVLTAAGIAAIAGLLLPCKKSTLPVTADDRSQPPTQRREPTFKED